MVTTRIYQEVRKWYRIIAVRANAQFYNRLNTQERVDVMAEDWDNLIILDACRYDMMLAHAPSGWKVDSRLSSASESSEFMSENFAGKDLHDTVYVTSNPHATTIPDQTFHDIHFALDSDWDSELETVSPQKMADLTLSAESEYPNKRLISHWMQPHFPFIGSRGRSLDVCGIGDQSGDDAPHPWVALMESRDINRTDVINAYRENLELAIDSVINVADKLTGKTVVTSDHGNLIGEWTGPIPIKTYGHPSRFHKYELINVPWVVLENDTRKIISDDPPQESCNVDDHIIEDRLKSLGYAE